MPDLSPVRFETGLPMLLAGLRRTHPFAEAERGIERQWTDFGTFDGLTGRIGTDRYGVMCGAGPGGFEYMTAVRVTSFDGLPEGAGRMRVPPQRYAVFVHPDAEGPLRTTWERIFAWLDRGDYASAHRPDFEVYVPGRRRPNWRGGGRRDLGRRGAPAEGVVGPPAGRAETVGAKSRCGLAQPPPERGPSGRSPPTPDGPPP